ncbi:MAG: hypothetical protein M3144_02855 [Actinomycetota bacterium]|nr:hypothetical protein [Actinomycetota bacterium]
MLVVAGLSHAREHALISLLALNGLRIPEALGAKVEDLGIERGHRTLLVRRKGGKMVSDSPRAPDGEGDRPGGGRGGRGSDRRGRLR